MWYYNLLALAAGLAGESELGLGFRPGSVYPETQIVFKIIRIVD